MKNYQAILYNEQGARLDVLTGESPKEISRQLSENWADPENISTVVNYMEEDRESGYFHIEMTGYKDFGRKTIVWTEGAR